MKRVKKLIFAIFSTAGITLAGDDNSTFPPPPPDINSFSNQIEDNQLFLPTPDQVKVYVDHMSKLKNAYNQIYRMKVSNEILQIHSVNIPPLYLFPDLTFTLIMPSQIKQVLTTGGLQVHVNKNVVAVSAGKEFSYGTLTLFYADKVANFIFYNATSFDGVVYTTAKFKDGSPDFDKTQILDKFLKYYSPEPDKDYVFVYNGNRYIIREIKNTTVSSEIIIFKEKKYEVKSFYNRD